MSHPDKPQQIPLYKHSVGLFVTFSLDVHMCVRDVCCDENTVHVDMMAWGHLRLLCEQSWILTMSGRGLTDKQCWNDITSSICQVRASPSHTEAGCNSNSIKPWIKFPPKTSTRNHLCIKCTFFSFQLGWSEPFNGKAKMCIKTFWNYIQGLVWKDNRQFWQYVWLNRTELYWIIQPWLKGIVTQKII